MEHWLREPGAPRIILRLRIPNSIEESATLLGRCRVPMAMNQRRRLKGWTLEQQSAGEPGVDPLTFNKTCGRQRTIRMNIPTRRKRRSRSSSAIFWRCLSIPRRRRSTEIALRRSREKAAPGTGETAEIEFYGAALGDDVGIVCPAAGPGDLGIAPDRSRRPRLRAAFSR